MVGWFHVLAAPAVAFLHPAGCSVPKGRSKFLATAVATETNKGATNTDDLHDSSSSSSFSSPSSSLSLSRTTTTPTTLPLERAAEIASVVAGKIVTPLLLSLFRNNNDGNILRGSTSLDWDEFWQINTDGLSNGERLALALEELGPTYVKFGQALASRPDVIPISLADSLEKLQDKMEPFDSTTAKSILREELSSGKMTDTELDAFLDSLGNVVGSASIGQVYKGYIPEYGDVAVKVQRPGIRQVVHEDAQLLRLLASTAEAIPRLPGFWSKTDSSMTPDRLIATDLVDAVEEFMSRIFEELDYKNEAANIERFAELYCGRKNPARTVPGATPIQVVVPELLHDYCTDNVIVMEWLEGTKLTDVDVDDTCAVEENIGIIEKGIQCTLHQLLSSGTVHADPHGGNLLKVSSKGDTMELGYLDFGLLSTVSPEVRDGLVCSVTSLIFANDIEAVASMFGELDLLPEDVVDDPTERAALTAALKVTMTECLDYEGSGPTNTESDKTSDSTTTTATDPTAIPKLKFDKLLDALVRLVPRFRFQLPPYFINNARAMSTLEGIARSLDPDFNVFRALYPYALHRLITNPSESPVVESTLYRLVTNPDTGMIDLYKAGRLLTDAAAMSGQKRRDVLLDTIKSKGGRRFARRLARMAVRDRYRSLQRRVGGVTRLFQL